MHASAYVGTAGWSVPRVHASHFPPDGSHLERYGARFNAVEINSSFYRPHRTSTYARWAAAVPDGFRFAVKVPKSVTHEKKLVDSGDLIARFLAEVGGLGGKLGPLLIQLPPRLAFQNGVSDSFLTDLRACFSQDLVCEPRHASWFSRDVDDLLDELKIARVAADPAPVAGGGNPGGWRGIAYYRLHGSPRVYYSPYGPDALDSISGRLAADMRAGIRPWCIFDNTAAFAATADALTIAGDKRIAGCT